MRSKPSRHSWGHDHGHSCEQARPSDTSARASRARGPTRARLTRRWNARAWAAALAGPASSARAYETQAGPRPLDDDADPRRPQRGWVTSKLGIRGEPLRTRGRPVRAGLTPSATRPASLLQEPQGTSLVEVKD